MISFEEFKSLFDLECNTLLSDKFDVFVDYVFNDVVGNGVHYMEYPLFRCPECYLEFGISNLKLNPFDFIFLKPEQFFDLTFTCFHELRHGYHKLMMHNELGLTPENKDMTIFYLAQASNPGFYRNGNQCNPFEVDANIYGTKKALEFCSKYWPGENFEQYAEKKRTKSECSFC